MDNFLQKEPQLIKIEGIAFKADEFGDLRFSIKVDVMINSLQRLKNTRGFIDGSISAAKVITTKGFTHHAFAEISVQEPSKVDNGDNSI